jgi:cardiolipin synthase
MTVTLPLWLLALLAATLGLLAVLYWSVKRRRRPRMSVSGDGGGLDEMERSLAGVCQGTLCDGNAVEVLEDGAFFDRLHEDLARAEHTIHLESYLAKEGEVTRCLAEALAKRAAAGVKVRVMLDASGGRGFGKDYLRQLHGAGVDVRFYHPLRLSDLGRLNNRDHRKIVVLDGRVGYVGGHCLVDTWLGRHEDKEHFRDITARVEGPVVAQLQAAFCENWVEETGELPAGEACFPRLEPVGKARAHAVWLSPQGSPSCVEVLHYLAINAARERITIQNPYFLPDPDGRRALVAAVQRGVRVRVMIPAADASDSAIVQHASHHHYGSFLQGGVELYDYQRTLLHQKVMTIDGRWSIIGSQNFDDRSFEINDEVTLAVCDEEVAARLEAIFERDLRHAKKVELEPWAHRPWRHKLVDFGSYLLNEQM